VPEARLVDGTSAPKMEPVAVKMGPSEPPMAKAAVAEDPSPAAPSGGCCATKHDCGAVGGFMLSLGSLVFGVVACPLFFISWPVGGSVGALVSCSALRRIRAGKGNPASAGLARAGVAIGIGQSLLGLVLIAALFAVSCRSGSGWGCGKMRCPRPVDSTISQPAQKSKSAPVKVEQKKQVQTETEEVEGK